MEDSDPIARYAGALEGQVAVVTGAGSGIGRAAAVALARSGAGVAVMGRRADRLEETVELIRSAGGDGRTAPVDVVDADAIDRSVNRVMEALGPPDVVVAAAGVNAWGELSEVGPEQVREALAVNIEGVANLARAVLPVMKDRGRGKLIVIASDNGRRPEAGGGAYVASKFGAVGLARSLSREMYRSPISVHVVEPGCVDTEWYPPEEDAPRDRMLSADDVALVVLFLATLPSHIVVEEVMPLPRGLLADPWE
jgi:NADP-dependent 3-hydroxy acid dehydrogenase YdfG